jgi:hypothetical protein
MGTISAIGILEVLLNMYDFLPSLYTQGVTHPKKYFRQPIDACI